MYQGATEGYTQYNHLTLIVPVFLQDASLLKQFHTLSVDDQANLAACIADNHCGDEGAGILRAPVICKLIAALEMLSLP